MSPRKPTPADVSGGIPALDEVRDGPPPEVTLSRAPSHARSFAMGAATAAAASAAVLATEDPQCGATRAEELVAHGPEVGDALRRAQVVSALREVAVAMGWTRHVATRGLGDGLRTAGVTMPVDTTPAVDPAPLPLPSMRRDPPPEDRHADGEMPRVRPTPPPRPPVREEPLARPGGRGLVRPHTDLRFK